MVGGFLGEPCGHGAEAGAGGTEPLSARPWGPGQGGSRPLGSSGRSVFPKNPRCVEPERRDPRSVRVGPGGTLCSWWWWSWSRRLRVRPALQGVYRVTAASRRRAVGRALAVLGGANSHLRFPEGASSLPWRHGSRAFLVSPPRWLKAKGRSSPSPIVLHLSSKSCLREGVTS